MLESASEQYSFSFHSSKKIPKNKRSIFKSQKTPLTRNNSPVPAKIFSAATIGLESELVEVEVDAFNAGMHHFTVVGLPDTTVKESRDRVSSALKNSGFVPPHRFGRITVNLAPADLPKNSSLYDVPMALGFLLATEQLSFDSHGKLFLGELSLDGKIRSVGGVLPISLLAKKLGFSEVYVPDGNATEASMVQGIQVLPITSLLETAKHLSGEKTIAPAENINPSKIFSEEVQLLDMSDIRGQEHAKRALEIAAAGGHNILMSGPPGSGKTALAKTLPSILPRLTFEESIEITKIFSVAGFQTRANALVTARPFRSPHHSASAASLVGGGSFPKPGEISLAHRGVLFLDEFGEFAKSMLENLRQPLEDGFITISRAKGSIHFPARFTLVAAMNPCPCGNLGDPGRICSCSPRETLRYKSKISGPILDRIDLHIEVPRLPFEKIETSDQAERSATIRERVERARDTQKKRFEGMGIFANAEMNSALLRETCPLDNVGKDLLKKAVSTLHLSVRAYYRIIKLARTIADLEDTDHILPKHLAEAVQYRFKAE